MLLTSGPLHMLFPLQGTVFPSPRQYLLFLQISSLMSPCVLVCLSFSSAWPRGSAFPRGPQALTCVSVPPAIADDQTDFTVTMMAPVVLTCHSTGVPAPVVSWSKAGTRLGVRGSGYRVSPSGE